MHVVVKGAEGIDEYILLKQKIKHQATQYANQHMSAGQWTEGDPVKTWMDNDANICIEYTSGKIYHYKSTPDGIRYW